MKLMMQYPASAMIGYQARLLWRVNLLVAFLISILLPSFTFLTGDSDAQLRIFWVLRILEQFSPLLGIAICSDMLSMEWENQTADIWLTKSYPRSGVVLSRFLVVAVLTIFSILLITGQFYLTYVHFDWSEMLLVAVPGALFLGMMGAFMGTLLRNSAASYIIPIAYWAFEMSTKGKYTGNLYLFLRTSIACYDAEEVCVAAAQFGPWLSSKLLVLSMSGLLMLLTSFILQRAGRKLSS